MNTFIISIISIIKFVISIILGGLVSYILYKKFTIRNLKKYIYSKIEDICNSPFALYKRIPIDIAKKLLENSGDEIKHINIDIQKMGVKDKNIILIQSKISFLQLQIEDIDIFINKYIIDSTKEFPPNFGDTLEYQNKFRQIYSFFYTDNILDNMVLKSKDDLIQKKYEEYLNENERILIPFNLLDNKFIQLKN